MKHSHPALGAYGPYDSRPLSRRDKIVSLIIIPPLAGAGVLIWVSRGLARRSWQLAGRARHPR